LSYLSRNVKISARKRKPLKLQTRIIASNVALDDVLIFNVEDEYNRKVCSVARGIYSILILVSSVFKVGYSVVILFGSTFDLTRTRNAEVGDVYVVVVVVICCVLITAERNFRKSKH
jgi:hypothetical protein